MRVCITSQGSEATSRPDERFGRAPYFIIFSEEDAPLVLPNPGTSAEHGAGVAAAQAVLAHKIDVLITGHLGPNAAASLRPAGIKVYALDQAKATVKANYEALLADELQPLES